MATWITIGTGWGARVAGSRGPGAALMVTLTTWVAGSVFSRMTTGGSGARDIRVSAPLPVHGQPLRLGRLGQNQEESEGERCCGAHGMTPVFLGLGECPTFFK